MRIRSIFGWGLVAAAIALGVEFHQVQKTEAYFDQCNRTMSSEVYSNPNDAWVRGRPKEMHNYTDELIDDCMAAGGYKMLDNPAPICASEKLPMCYH